MKQLRTKCRQEIYQTGNHHYCSRYAIEGTDFCKFHNPEYVAARAKEREFKDYLEWKVKNFRQNRDEMVRQIIMAEIFSGITTEEIRKNKSKLKAVFKATGNRSVRDERH
ncbi:hypothetical protein ABFB50_00980 [Dehalococcoides sp. THU3]|uniref:hypothetical protein n=1 Tax=Dehalococcoides TaxID=61434 RepID=UPI0032189AC0